MSRKRIGWTAVAIFAAVMTVAEVFAVQALARDARRWMSSDTAREIRTAGRAVAGVVTGRRGATRGAEFALARFAEAKGAPVIVCRTGACKRHRHALREVKWSWSNAEI